MAVCRPPPGVADTCEAALGLGQALQHSPRQLAADLGTPVTFRVADVVDPLPFPRESFDTVTALHLLEHLPPRLTAAALAGLCRVARRRVVLAVPLEQRPDPVYGHLQAFDLHRLAACGQALSPEVVAEVRKVDPRVACIAFSGQEVADKHPFVCHRGSIVLVDGHRRARSLREQVSSSWRSSQLSSIYSTRA